MYLLDTDICVAVLRGRVGPRDHLLGISNEAPIFTTVANHAELAYGALKARQPEQEQLRVAALLRLLDVLPFETGAAEIFGREKLRLERQGQSISDLDLIIASIALQHDLTVVTHNVREFQRVQGLSLEDWLA